MYIVISYMDKLDISSFFLMLLQIVAGCLIFIIPAGIYCLKVKCISFNILKIGSK